MFGKCFFHLFQRTPHFNGSDSIIRSRRDHEGVCSLLAFQNRSITEINLRQFAMQLVFDVDFAAAAAAATASLNERITNIYRSRPVS